MTEKPSIKNNDIKLKQGKHLKNFRTALVPNLNNKDKYVVHIDNLKYSLSKGLVLSKIHRMISFKQTEWLAPYIEFNTQKRQQSSNDFEKDYYNLMNNAFYGKTKENIRGHTDVNSAQQKESSINI